MSVLRFFVFSLIHIVYAQFPQHLDLQKVGEIIFNNDKYNVLKPTVHKVTDYFKDFMLRRENKSDQKIFIDDNGFRHFWSGIGKIDQNLRKTEIYGANIEAERKKQQDEIEKTETTTVDVYKPEEIQEVAPNEALRQAKKVAKTSFFCPFFGVITMTSPIEDVKLN